MTTSLTPMVQLQEDTLPPFLCDLLYPDFDYTPFLVPFGATFEVSLTLLSEVEPSYSNTLKEYWLKSRGFFDLLAKGEIPHDYLEVHRLIAYHEQNTSKNAKKDLVELLNFLNSDPNLAPILAEITQEKPATASSSPFLTSIQADGDYFEYVVDIPGKSDYQTFLGGQPSRAEIGRRFVFTISYAPWRDRKVRRLVAAKIYSQEIWPKK